MTDWAEVYRANVEAVCALAETLHAEDLSRLVPATPDWTVHDLLAHLAGTPADLLADRMDDAPSPAWTARQVDARAARSPADLVAELQSNVDAVVATLEGNERPALVWDAAVHHADLHEALGKGAPPEQMWRPVLEALAPRMLGESADAVGEVPDYELFRAFFSRRSRIQMLGWGTPLEPAMLDGLCIFGPRDDDQPVPERGRLDPA
jgi:uncharacterized protein (TIGR03083 family)